MMETRVQRSRLNHFRQAQLLNAAKALKVGMVDDVEQELRRNCYKAVNRVVEYFFLVQEKL